MNEDTFNELDPVVLMEEVENVPKGAGGTIVEIFTENIFLVEFADRNGVAYAFLTLPASKSLKLKRAPINNQYNA